MDDSRPTADQSGRLGSGSSPARRLSLYPPGDRRVPPVAPLSLGASRLGPARLGPARCGSAQRGPDGSVPMPSVCFGGWRHGPVGGAGCGRFSGPGYAADPWEGVLTAAGGFHTRPPLLLQSSRTGGERNARDVMDQTPRAGRFARLSPFAHPAPSPALLCSPATHPGKTIAPTSA